MEIFLLLIYFQIAKLCPSVCTAWEIRNAASDFAKNVGVLSRTLPRQVPSTAKFPLPPKKADFMKSFFSYLDIWYVTPPTTNERPSLYYRLWINQKLQEIVFAKSATFGVKVKVLNVYGLGIFFVLLIPWEKTGFMCDPWIFYFVNFSRRFFFFFHFCNKYLMRLHYKLAIM